MRVARSGSASIRLIASPRVLAEVDEHVSIAAAPGELVVAVDEDAPVSELPPTLVARVVHQRERVDLGDDRLASRRRSSRRKDVSLETPGDRQVEAIEQGRHHVGLRYEVSDTTDGVMVADVLDEERDADLRLAQRVAVSPSAVLAHQLAVVGGDEDPRVVVHARVAQGDRTVARAAGRARRSRRRRARRVARAAWGASSGATPGGRNRFAAAAGGLYGQCGS